MLASTAAAATENSVGSTECGASQSPLSPPTTKAKGAIAVEEGGRSRSAAEAAADLFRRLPKAELHVHIEGTLEPEMMFEMAKKNEIEITHKSVEDCREAFRHYEGLEGFITEVVGAMDVLLTEQDFYDMTIAYLEKANADNICHAEMMIDCFIHTRRGVAISDILGGLKRARDEVWEKYKMSTTTIYCINRMGTEEEAMALLDKAVEFKHLVEGAGLVSEELNYPPKRFTKVFERCRSLGWYITVHAGETAPPDYIISALDDLKATRIDHGVTCVSDRQLVHRLRAEQVPLTVCPVSNVKLGVAKSLKDHPLASMLKAGLNCSFNSDDPAFFDGMYINDAFAAWCAENPRVTPDDARRLAANSIRSAVMTDKTRQQELLKAVMTS